MSPSKALSAAPCAIAMLIGTATAVSIPTASSLELSSGTFVRPGNRLILRARGNGIFTFNWSGVGSAGETCSASGFVDSLSGSGKPDSDPGCKITIAATVGGVAVATKRIQCLSFCANAAPDGIYLLER